MGPPGCTGGKAALLERIESVIEVLEQTEVLAAKISQARSL